MTLAPHLATVVNVNWSRPMDLSELIEEFRENEIYDTNPQDWMGYLFEDDYYVPDVELAY